MKKQEIINEIKNRIQTEHEKYSGLENWPEIAAHKIYNSITLVEIIKLQDVPDEKDCMKNTILSYKLSPDNGISTESSIRISPLQWELIKTILHEF